MLFPQLTRLLLFPRYLVPPPPVLPATAAEGREVHRLMTNEGPVEYWFLRAKSGSPSRPLPVVLYAHGNGERIEQWVEPLSLYRARGVHLLLVEYRGYGRSAGQPSEPALVSDWLHIADWVSKQPYVDPNRIIYHGRSIGGGVVCGAARARPPAGLILESTFTDLASVTRRFLVPSFLLPDTFDNLGALRDFAGPCLIMHGTADHTIPLSHGETLAKAGRHTQLRTFPRAGHNTLLTEDPSYWAGVDWLLQALADTPAQSPEGGAG